MRDIILDGKKIQVDIVHKPIKHAYIRIKDRNSIFVTAGLHFSEQALSDLIRRHQQKLIRMLNSIQAQPLYEANQTAIFGKLFQIEERESSKTTIVVDHDRVVIAGKRKDLRWKALERYYQQEVINAATDLLADMNESLGQEIRLSGIILKSQRMKTQLGSCMPAKRIIKLNSILGRFERRYLQAILIHELIHLQIRGHQEDFYRFLYRYLPNYHILRKELLAFLKQM
ncbi:MAG: DUF45 domain-containing protein [Candidatus Izemoplasmatales bacterium]|jgi:hypothetical protein|nr:DUF45 domain-containing protein [Candidatus Izemoplasmatales bacterium]MDD4354269.1 DUF45 domain-containing protein [Candidatus Izemoplasmatales bacterium]MDD4987273.1 DUF45 domain-containing protein [Candidatus Izemoplasmatales bacterium]MDD5601498.1 DUF45 domain-containing protein [Candidatus Izemoplasmatales bacterium]MDY0373191.1 DUF45 domain-containing protein [Candidatus Izemoplasmatales bacterium]